MIGPLFGKGELRGGQWGDIVFHECFCTLLVGEILNKFVGTTLHAFLVLHTFQVVLAFVHRTVTGQIIWTRDVSFSDMMVYINHGLS